MRNRWLFILVLLLVAGCSGGGSRGSSSATTDPGSIDLQLRLDKLLARTVEETISVLIVRVVDAEFPDRDVVNPLRIELDSQTSGTLLRKLTGVAPGSRRVLVQAFDLEGQLLGVADSGTFDLRSGTAVTVSLSLAPGNHLAFRTQPAGALAGQTLTPPVEVVVLDAGGNLAAASNLEVTLSLGQNPGSATLGGTTTVAAVGGVATFPDLHLDQPGQGYTLVASAAELAGDESQPFTIATSVLPPARLTFLTQPSAVVHDQVLAPALQVAVQDENGVLVTSATNPVTLSLSSGTLSGTLTVQPVNGVATFSDLSASPPGTGYTLAASSPGLTGATSDAFDVLAFGTPSRLRFTTQPVSSLVASVLPAVEVQVEDSDGNRVTSPDVPVTLALGANPGGATLTGTLTVNSVAGVATFSDLSLDQPGTGYTLAASSGSLTGDTSAAFNLAVTNGVPTAVIFSAQPTDEFIGSPIDPAVQVSVVDSNGVVVPGATNSITVAIGNNPGDAFLTGTLNVNAVNGVATFSDLNLDQLGSGYTLTASSPGLTGATSVSFDVVIVGARLDFSGLRVAWGLLRSLVALQPGQAGQQGLTLLLGPGFVLGPPEVVQGSLVATRLHRQLRQPD